jgi:hypothetical protein
MGYYINQMPNGDPLPRSGKVEKLLTIDGVIKMTEPEEFMEDIVCVVDNGAFDAAVYAFNESELNYFKKDDGRDKTWLRIPGAKELAK